MSNSEGHEWGPAVRRSTAPSRPGVRRTAHSQPEEAHRSSSILPSVETGVAVPTTMSIEEAMVVRPSSASVVVEGLSQEQCGGRGPEFKLRLMKNNPVTLLEMKGTCRLDVDKCVDLKLNFEKTTCEEKKKETSETAAISGPTNSVYNLSDKQKFFMDREIRKKMGEQRLMVDATDDSEEIHQLEGRRQVLNNSFGRYFVIDQNSDGSFAAHPVKNWMLLQPSVKYKTLSCDEADVEYEKRDKTLNYFSVMVQKRLRTEDDSDDEEKKILAKKRGAYRKKEDSWVSSESELELESEDEEKSSAISSTNNNVRRSGRSHKKKNFGNEYLEELGEDDEDSHNSSYHASQSTGE